MVKEEMHLTYFVPFLVEDELMRLGATFEKLPNWQPASSTVAAQNVLNLLSAEKAA